MYIIYLYKGEVDRDESEMLKDDEIDRAYL